MKFKQILRIAGLALLLSLALCGIGPPPNLNRPRDFENKIQIERVEKKRDDEITDVDTQKEVKQ